MAQILSLDGSSLVDASPQQHPITAHGSVTIQQGRLYFGGNGLADYLSSPPSSDWQFSSDNFQVEFVAEFAAVASDGTTGYVLLAHRNASSDVGWAISRYAGKWGFHWTANGTTYSSATANDVLAVGQSHTYRFTRSSNTLSIAKNGTVIGSGPISGSIFASSQPLRIGGDAANAGGFNGWLSVLTIERGNVVPPPPPPPPPATAQLAPLIAAAAPGSIIELAANTTYDDAGSILITKDVELNGPRSAVVHSEFQVLNGALLKWTGFSPFANKMGVPSITGFPHFPYPQNGQVVVRGGLFWCDDCWWTCAQDYDRMAIQCIFGNLQIQAKTQYSPILWAPSTTRVMQILYGSHCNILSYNTVDPNNYVEMTCRALASAPGNPTDAIQVAGSKLRCAGVQLHNTGSTPAGVKLVNWADALFERNCIIDGFSQATSIDGTSRQLFT